MSGDSRETIGLKQFLRDVNVRDFFRMIEGEARQLGSNLRVSFEAFPRLPWGPLLALGGLVMVLIRFVLLLVVIVVFGAGILLITAVRTFLNLFNR